jgi:predicted amidohydrolase YtcJ
MKPNTAETSSRPPVSVGRFVSLPLACLVGLIVGTGGWAEEMVEPADHIFTGKHIITMEPGFDRIRKARATALAVRGDRIVWMGDQRDAEALVGEGTEVHELGDQALLPGFIDAHGHLSFMGATVALANLAPPPVGPVTSFETLKATLNEYIETNQIPEGSWVVGFGYDDSLMDEKDHPDRRVLDEVSKGHPIALTHVSGHLATANSLGLARAGIDSETPDPSGGHIRRYPNSNEPTGVLEETATYRLRAEIMQPRGNPLDTVTNALQAYAQNGVTTAQDGGAHKTTLQLLQAAASAGLLNIDVIAYHMVGNNDLTAVDGIPFGRYQDRLKVGGVKMMLDGSPQGKTAYLTKPYQVPPPGQSAEYRGYPILPDKAVDAMVAAYLSARIPILAHANGDAAADQLVNAVGRAAPKTDHRTVMIHAQTVREDQLDRMAELGMIPSFFSAHVFFWGDWHRDSVLGPERGSRISPTRSAWDRQMAFTLHNDAPVVPPDMIRLIWATTNRLTRSGQVLGAEQRLTTFEALSAVTRMAAYQNFEEDEKGTLEVGKLADLVVLSADPLSMDTADLLEVEVRQTWSRGMPVYETGSE